MARWLPGVKVEELISWCECSQDWWARNRMDFAHLMECQLITDRIDPDLSVEKLENTGRLVRIKIVVDVSSGFRLPQLVGKVLGGQYVVPHGRPYSTGNPP